MGVQFVELVLGMLLQQVGFDQRRERWFKSVSTTLQRMLHRTLQPLVQGTAKVSEGSLRSPDAFNRVFAPVSRLSKFGTVDCTLTEITCFSVDVQESDDRFGLASII